MNKASLIKAIKEYKEINMANNNAVYFDGALEDLFSYLELQWEDDSVLTVSKNDKEIAIFPIIIDGEIPEKDIIVLGSGD
jgi:hypothetical protein